MTFAVVSQPMRASYVLSLFICRQKMLVEMKVMKSKVLCREALVPNFAIETSYHVPFYELKKIRYIFTKYSTIDI